MTSALVRGAYVAALTMAVMVNPDPTSAAAEPNTQDHAQAAHAGHPMTAPGSLTWTPAGPGISVSVLSGSPDKEGSAFALRLKLDGGTRVPPHWHPVEEHLTVLSGTFYMGVGAVFDETTAAAMPAGTYAVVPKDVRHFGWTGTETIVQIHGIGPFKTYPVEQPMK